MQLIQMAFGCNMPLLLATMNPKIKRTQLYQQGFAMRNFHRRP